MIKNFIDNLLPLDFVLFGSSFGLFILFIILAILLKGKTFISLVLFVMAFSSIIVGPTYGYVKLHEYLFPKTVKLTSQKKLTFTKAVVVYGELTNDSKNDFSICTINASAYKVSTNEYKNYLFKFNPFKKVSILEYEIAKGQTREFKAILEPFHHSKDYNITLEASCR